MDNSTNWDNSPPEDLSKSWEENCQDQLRNIRELNQLLNFLRLKMKCTNL